MTRVLAVLMIVVGALATSAPASAHCDTTRGPVVMAARAALDAGDPNLVLRWVRPDDEAAVRGVGAVTRTTVPLSAASRRHGTVMGFLFAANDGALPAPAGEMEQRCWQTLRSALVRKQVLS
jgi:hypothetical protein